MNATIPQKDNFDMTTAAYVYIQKLNRVRAQYLTLECDAPLNAQVPGGATNGGRVYAWERGCMANGVNSLVLTACNFDRYGNASGTVSPATSWAQGDSVVDVLNGATMSVGTGGALDIDIAGFRAARCSSTSTWRRASCRWWSARPRARRAPRQRRGGLLDP